MASREPDTDLDAEVRTDRAAQTSPDTVLHSDVATDASPHPLRPVVWTTQPVDRPVGQIQPFNPQPDSSSGSGGRPRDQHDFGAYYLTVPDATSAVIPNLPLFQDFASSGGSASSSDSSHAHGQTGSPFTTQESPGNGERAVDIPQNTENMPQLDLLLRTPSHSGSDSDGSAIDIHPDQSMHGAHGGTCTASSIPNGRVPFVAQESSDNREGMVDIPQNIENVPLVHLLQQTPSHSGSDSDEPTIAIHPDQSMPGAHEGTCTASFIQNRGYLHQTPHLQVEDMGRSIETATEPQHSVREFVPENAEEPNGEADPNATEQETSSPEQITTTTVETSRNVSQGQERSAEGDEQLPEDEGRFSQAAPVSKQIPSQYENPRRRVKSDGDKADPSSVPIRREPRPSSPTPENGSCESGAPAEAAGEEDAVGNPVDAASELETFQQESGAEGGANGPEVADEISEDLDNGAESEMNNPENGVNDGASRVGMGLKVALDFANTFFKVLR